MAIKTAEMLNVNSCLNKAAPDEPIFVLRANDTAAPAAVRAWAQLYRLRKETRREFNRRELEKYQEAMTLAIQMENWKRDNP